MRVSQNKSRPEETPKFGFHKPPTKIFAAASKIEKPIYAPCLQLKGRHPLWSCSVFKKKTPTLRAQFPRKIGYVLLAFNLTTFSENALKPANAPSLVVKAPITSCCMVLRKYSA